jgi:hypothetical protein
MAHSKATRVAAKVLIAIVSVSVAHPAAADDLKIAPLRLTLQVPRLEHRHTCLRTTQTLLCFSEISLHRTFRDDFDMHPLQSGKWVPHYTGPVVMPESFYAGGQASRPERKSKYNGEQEIYVDPSYEGRSRVPLGLDHSAFAMASSR